jgi:tRNA-guanine family transglycosylase
MIKFNAQDSQGGGLHRFLRKQGSLFCLTQHEALLDEAGRVAGNQLKLHTSQGLRPIDSKSLCELQQQLRADIVIALAEDVGMFASRKRVSRAVQRSINWLDAYLQAEASDDTKEAYGMLLANIQGAGDLQERAKCAAAMALKNVDGFAFGGLFAGETQEETVKCIRTIMVSF